MPKVPDQGRDVATEEVASNIQVETGPAYVVAEIGKVVESRD